jgi:hypothetical protein
MPLFPREPERFRKRKAADRVPVWEEHPDRTWRPEQKCPAPAMDVVLTILLEADDQWLYQSDLVQRVIGRMGVKQGTAASYVSGALLAFHEAGWVEPVVRDRKSPAWKVVED